MFNKFGSKLAGWLDDWMDSC